MYFLDPKWLMKNYNIIYTAGDIAKMFNVKPAKIRGRVYYLKKFGYKFASYGTKIKPQYRRCWF